jgi:HK97 gp10 family phage protein
MATFRGMDVGIAITGLETLRHNLERVDRRLIELSAQKVRASCARIVHRAKLFAPYETGTLQRAITYRLQGQRGYVGVDGSARRSDGHWPAQYWRFLEFGTVRVQARPFFRPAAEADKGIYVRDMQSIGPALERIE